nr:MAG TPA: hypothetical protein [Caudoviricetes sp.]
MALYLCYIIRWKNSAKRGKSWQNSYKKVKNEIA